MDINNPSQAVPYLQTPDGKTIGLWTVAIGAWDMNSYTTTQVAHNLGTDWENILSVKVMIHSDDGDYLYPLGMVSGPTDTGPEGGGVGQINDTNITLHRITSGFFDLATFSSEAKSRGNITFLVLY